MTAHLGTGTGGTWTRRQALAVTTAGRVDGHVRRGEWQVLWPGVYADAGIQLGLEQRGHAAVLASGTGAVVCGRLAARLHGLPLVDDDDPATGAREHLVDDVAVPHAAVALVGAGGRRLLRHRWRYAAEDVTSLHGIPVTAVHQTVLDCARLLPREALVCLLDATLHRSLLPPEELARLVDERRWAPGVVALRAAAALADGRAESPLETLVRLLLQPYLPGLEPQHRLLDRHGRVLARFDLAHRLLRLAVEADGRAGHLGSAARDQRRDRTAEAYGWRTERCTWFEVRRQQDQLVRRAVAAGRAQAARHGLRIV